MGLVGSMPLLLQSRGASYSEQALFSFVRWPYSLKILWAPLVDAFFSSSVGRRRSWILPVQLGIGFALLALAGSVEALLDNVPLLTALFFAVYVLVATQDIAVDGWALTLLSPKNVGYASTCNTVGQTLGYFTSYTVFLALNSPAFCNAYLRSVPADQGLVSLPAFLTFWGLVFLAVTAAVAVFTSEPKTTPHQRVAGTQWADVVAAYKEVAVIWKRPGVRSLVFVLATARVGVVAAERILPLKLLEKGFPREHLAMLGVAMTPLELAMPVLLGRFTAGPRPLDLWLWAYPLRLLVGTGIAAAVATASPLAPVASVFAHPAWVYLALLGFGAVHRVACNTQFVSQMAFFARVSDPRVGGTYMTLLNTVGNLGNHWPAPLYLSAMEQSSIADCTGASDPALTSCVGKPARAACLADGGTCVPLSDAFPTILAVALCIGVAWAVVMFPRVLALQARPQSEWRLPPADASALDDVVDEEEQQVELTDQGMHTPSALD